jgi:ubiquinone/menaquinone biosynthesis C-methylase UbiE
MGWQVSAFDYSSAARDKALALAAERGVQLDYITSDFDALPYAPASFDAIALIFAHFPLSRKTNAHRLWDRLLKPGGYLILEAFSKDHLQYNADGKAGGPRDIDMLYSTDELRRDFADYEPLLLQQTETVLEEGLYHQGLSSVVQYLGRKPLA